MLNSSRIFGYLAAAAPGLAELVTIGKVWELAQLERKTSRRSPYDLVIVDLPATGHGLAMLRAPRTFGDIARVGPIPTRPTASTTSSPTRPRPRAVAVALPEEMPVNETLELGERLKEEMGKQLAVDRGQRPLPGALQRRRGRGHRRRGRQAARRRARGALAAALPSTSAPARSAASCGG